MSQVPVDDLLETLQHSKSADDVFYVAQHLRDIGDARAVEPLLERLSKKSDPSWLREELIIALLSSMLTSGFKPQIAADLLLEIFSSESETEEVKSKAALVLGAIHDQRALKPFLETLRADMAGGLAYPCIVGLGDLGDPSGIDILIEIVQAQKFLLPQAAAEALGKIGPPAAKAVPALQNLAKRGNEAEKRYALEAVTKILG